ncbi:hypothetical protein KCP91_08775 [Microvirga sp. SRT01]|jgi:hypothetical protein|uniref:HIG1 domain-containing protein n=1 Tax=Sphingomonas longa TaxID=2778730 RepID=A0ABS2D8M6_9SPHN|nr:MULTISPECIES: hypothetical protein [Alphaproteobacteria]MBM6576466.1 hypothetical protein [Sphingomonas sp. BT552]MBR7709512.1 hypothetical protein [Microvirga sp. SRT01]
MSYNVVVMYVVAAVLGIAGVVLLLRLRGNLSERQVYAYRMIGIMAASAGIVLAMSATAMWRWSMAI